MARWVNWPSVWVAMPPQRSGGWAFTMTTTWGGMPLFFDEDDLPDPLPLFVKPEDPW